MSAMGKKNPADGWEGSSSTFSGARSISTLPPESAYSLPNNLLKNLRLSHNWEETHNWFDACHPRCLVPGEWEHFQLEVQSRIWKPDPSRFLDLSIVHGHVASIDREGGVVDGAAIDEHHAAGCDDGNSTVGLTTSSRGWRGVHKDRSKPKSNAKLPKQGRAVPWRKIGRRLALGGVAAGCIAGTAATHGIAAPIFVLLVATIAWAEEDARKEKESKSAEAVAKVGSAPDLIV